jgi:16S rRNA (uracil1498-N3)-methyltransferase
MPHCHRFHVATDTPEVGTVFLGEAESHHALRVVRLKPGEAVELFDGAGRVWLGAYEQVGKREAAVQVERSWVEAAPTPRLTLLQASLHRDAAIEELIRRGTEIGVTRFLFFRAARSEHATKLGAKLEKVAIETCKQCGRNWLPEIGVADDPLALVRDNPDGAYIAAMAGEPMEIGACKVNPDSLLLVGPEGDFTDDELTQFIEAGATPITLGAYTYRAEVAAVLGATLLLQQAGAFRIKA